jgi:broad specificity phosphatase PhoE
MRHCERADCSFDSQNDLAENQNDPPLSVSGAAHAREVAEELAASPCGQRIDVVVTSPYTRCLETASIIAERLDRPLCVDPALQEVLARTLFSHSDGSRPTTSRSIDECISFAKKRGVRILTRDALPTDEGSSTGATKIPFWEARSEPVWPESVPQEFRRYKEAFYDYANDGRSFFLVTHTLAVQAIAKKCTREERALHHKHVQHGFYFFCSPLSADIDASTNSTSSISMLSMVDFSGMPIDLPKKEKARARGSTSNGSGSFSFGGSFEAGSNDAFDPMRRAKSEEGNMTSSPVWSPSPDGSPCVSLVDPDLRKLSRGSLLIRGEEGTDDAHSKESSTRKSGSWAMRLSGSVARLLARRKESKEKSRAKMDETLIRKCDEKEPPAERT